jgi:hypothetical protein
MARNLLKEGVDWLKDMTVIATEETVTVNSHGVEVETKASLVDEEGRLLPGQVAVKTEHTMFLFRTELVTLHELDFQRSTLITWSGNTYQVAASNNKFWVYNDPFKTHVLVRTKHVSS